MSDLTAPTGGGGLSFGGGSDAAPQGGFSLSQPTTNQSSTNSVDGLLSLAQSQGGSLASAADEMIHPTSNILSTIGDGFKNAFHDFVDVISAPSQMVAGTINSVKTGQNLITSVGDAIKNNISPADVLFGKENPNNNGMQKVGSFLTRIATNILLDPLTYVTFGAGKGLFGLRATSEVTLGENAVAHITDAGFGPSVKIAGDVASLSKEGQQVYGYLQKVIRQVRGDTSAEIIKTGNADLDMSGSLLATLIRHTIDAPFNPDFAKQALTGMLEKNPALTETLLDKGGIKFFNKSVLSGQRIASVMKMVPGVTTLDHITQPIRQAIAAPFSPNMIKVGNTWTRLPPEYTDAVQAYKDLAGSWGNKAVGDIKSIIDNNHLSTTEGSFLTAAVEAGYRPADARLAKAWDGFFNMGQDQYKMMKDAGIPVQYLNRYVPHMNLKEDITAMPFKMPPSTAAGAAIHRTMEGPIFNATSNDLAEIEKQLVANPEAAAQGDVAKMLQAHKNDGFQIFDDNIASAWAKRSADNIRATTAKYFVKNVAENYGLPESVGKAVGYVPINSKGIKDASEDFSKRVFGEGGEAMVYHPAIAQHIENFMGSVMNDDAMKDAFASFDKLQNFFKGSVTSYFLAFHGRNAISNVLQNMYDLGVHALNPMYHYQAASLINDNRIAESLRAGVESGKEGAAEQLSALMNKKYFTDTTGNDWTFGEISQVAKNHNIAFSKGAGIDSGDFANNAKNALFGPETAAGKAKQFITQTANPLSTKNAGFSVGKTVGNNIEEQARLLNFTANLRNTGDVMLAAKRTKQFLFDYGSLTNFEKQVAKRIIPFYTYTKKNIELQMNTLLSTPGRISAQVQGLQTLGEVLSGGNQLSDQEYAALPDWMKSGIGILTKKNGEIVTMLSSLGTPIEQPFQALQANQFLGSLSPILRLPLEQMAGYSLFQGKPLSDVTNATAFANAPQFIKAFIGYTSVQGHRSDGTPITLNVSLDPWNMNIINNLPPFTRVLGSLKQMQAVDVSDQAKILQQLIGIKPYSFDLVQEAQKRQNEQKAQLQALLTKAGVTAQYQTTYISKAQKALLAQ